MRGKGRFDFGILAGEGITPAYAGKRATDLPERFSDWDHPRLCGEKFQHLPSTLFQQGSPPPMRGKVLYGCPYSYGCRITPAYAGKSNKSRILVAVILDHPRLCGEKFGDCLILQVDQGSPPPMRGKALLVGLIDLS